MKYKKMPIEYKDKKIEKGHVVRVVTTCTKRYNGTVGIVFSVNEYLISFEDKNKDTHRWSPKNLRKVYITDADILLYHIFGHKAALKEIEKREKKKIKKMLKTRKKNAIKKREQ